MLLSATQTIHPFPIPTWHLTFYICQLQPAVTHVKIKFVVLTCWSPSNRYKYSSLSHNTRIHRTCRRCRTTSCQSRDMNSTHCQSRVLTRKSVQHSVHSPWQEVQSHSNLHIQTHTYPGWRVRVAASILYAEPATIATSPYNTATLTHMTHWHWHIDIHTYDTLWHWHIEINKMTQGDTVTLTQWREQRLDIPHRDLQVAK